MSDKWPLDWDNDNDYSYLTEKTSKKQYAWEFLRRNPVYIEDFEKNKDLIKENKFLRLDRSMPDPANNHLLCHWTEDMCDWYGLSRKSRNFDPANRTPPTFQSFPPVFPIFSVPEVLSDPELNGVLAFPKPHITDEPSPGDFQVWVSTDYDRETQIKAIDDFFKEHRKKHAESKPIKHYKNFVRILDALSKGFSPEEIWNSGLYIDNETINLETVESHFEKAKKLRDGGYIRIVKSMILKKRPKVVDYDNLHSEDTGMLRKFVGKEAEIKWKTDE